MFSDIALIKKLLENASTSKLAKGDTVCVKLTVDELRELQRGHGGYSIRMESVSAYLGKK